MQTFYRLFTWTIIVGILIFGALWAQEKHLTGGSGSGTYRPGTTPTAINKKNPDYGVFRVDSTKPDVRKLEWWTPTTGNSEKWVIRLDDGDEEKFETLEKANERLEKYGLEWRPLTQTESLMKWVRSLF